MAVDLKSNSFISRSSLVIMPDSLVKLEHTRTQDRVKRFTFDTIERVMIWKRFLWGRLITVSLLLLAPGVLLIVLNRDTALIVCGSILAAIGGGLAVWYLICRKTTIRILRGGTTTDITGIYRPGKVAKFRDKLIRGILDAQTAFAPTSLATETPAAIDAAEPAAS